MPSWALALTLCAATAAPSFADDFASYRAGDSRAVLMTEPCAAPKAAGLKQARGRQGGRSLDGCWAADAGGNPVVTWNDGEIWELKASRIELAPKYAAVLRDIDALPPTSAGPAPATFARPAWCPHARRPHEKLICSDADLSAEDLKLAPLWQSYRDRLKLGPAEQRLHKDEFYRRQLACGADKACLAREQAARIAFYRDAQSRP